MNAATKTALITALAAAADGVPLDSLGMKATDIAEAQREGICTVVSAFPADGNIVRLTKAGYAAIPVGKSTTPAQNAVLKAIGESASDQLSATSDGTGLYTIDGVKPATLLEMVARGWLKAEYVEACPAEGETPATPATVSLSLTKDGTKAAAFPIRAARTAGAGGTRTSNGPTEHAPLPSTFTKTYLATEFTCHHDNGTFTCDQVDGPDGKPFTSLTAMAKAIRATKGTKAGEVNGWAFFGLTK